MGVALFSALVSSCAADSVLDAPPGLEDAEGLLVAIRAPNRPVRVWARPGVPFLLNLDGTEPDGTEVAVVAIREGLEALGLVQGSLSPAAAPGRTIASLLEVSYVSTVADGQVLPLEPGAPSEEVLGFPVQTLDFCPTISDDELSIVTRGGEAYGHALSGGPLARGRLELLDFAADGTLQTWTATSGARILGLAEAEGRVFLLLADGLYELRSRTPLSAERILPMDASVADTRIRALHVVQTEPRWELLGLSDAGVLFRHIDGAWAEIFRVPEEVKRQAVLEQPHFFSDQPGLIYAGADELTHLIRIRGEAVDLSQVGDLTKGFAASGIDHLGRRFIVDAYDGRVYTLEPDGSWAAGVTFDLVDVVAVVPWGDGLVAGSGKGPIVGVLHDPVHRCRPEKTRFPGLYTIVNVGGRLLGAGGAGSAVEWRWLTAPLD